MVNMGLVPTPPALVAPLPGCHNLPEVPQQARLRRVQMSVLLARLHRLSGRVTRARITQITGVVSALQAVFPVRWN
jgi:hypothetical protein